MTRKKIIWISSIVVILLLIIIAIIYYINNRIVIDNTSFTLVDDLNVNIYSVADASDFVEQIDGEIISSDEIDTTRLGEQTVSFLYLNKDNKKRKGVFEVEVRDLESPLVWLGNSYSVPVNSEDDFIDSIMCADNYDSNPSCIVEGSYDLSTVGSYDLKFVAKDSSNNESIIDFTLYVYDNTNIDSSPQENNDIVVTNFEDVLNDYKTDDTEIGIDVSKWQGEINFTKVKEAGANFVMIRVGSQQGVGGEYILDPYFEENIKKALENDLKVGIYFYSYADSTKEAEKQADWVLKQIDNYDINLPIAFDWECYSFFNQMELSLFGLNQVAESFLEKVEKEGYDGMLYGSKNYLNSIWKYHDYDVWLAHYTDETDYDDEYVMWQLCQNGVIDGINGMVDINILFRNI